LERGEDEEEGVEQSEGSKDEWGEQLDRGDDEGVEQSEGSKDEWGEQLDRDDDEQSESVFEKESREGEDVIIEGMGTELTIDQMIDGIPMNEEQCDSDDLDSLDSDDSTNEGIEMVAV